MSKYIGHGTVISMSTLAGSTASLLALGQVRNIDGPSATANIVDVTTLDSSGAFVEKASALLDGGQLSMTILWHAGSTVLGHAQLVDAYTAKRAQLYQITDNSSSVETFDAIVQALGRAIQVDDVITCEVTLEVTGDPGYST